jgi:DNA repair protein RadC
VGNPAQIEDPNMTTNTITLRAQLEDGTTRPATSDEIIATARRYTSARLRRGVTLSGPQTTCDFLSLRLGSLDHEVFAVIFLDQRNRVIDYQVMFRGDLNSSSVYPRQVVKEALKQNAAAVIFAHPHPSGVAEPSHADEAITKRLTEALQLVDIRVLDHIVVAGGSTVSFAARGLL